MVWFVLHCHVWRLLLLRKVFHHVATGLKRIGIRSGGQRALNGKAMEMRAWHDMYPFKYSNNFQSKYALCESVSVFVVQHLAPMLSWEIQIRKGRRNFKVFKYLHNITWCEMKNTYIHVYGMRFKKYFRIFFFV